MRSDRNQPESTSIRRELVSCRLDVLRFDPAFHGALACSPMGDLTALWLGLGEDQRRELEDFAKVHHRLRRLEMQGEMGQIPALVQTIATAHPLFRPLVEVSDGDDAHSVSEMAQHD